MLNFLFVCTANICRSPVAAALFQQELLANHFSVSKDQVLSAGTWGKNGLPADRKMVKILKLEYGLSLEDHRSLILDQSTIESRDLILVMGNNHREALQIEFPHKKEQIFLLSEMVGQDFEIIDPYQRSLKTHQQVTRQIYEIIHIGFAEIIRRATGQ